MRHVLFKISSSGGTNYWAIENMETMSGVHGFNIKYGQIGGSPQKEKIEVDLNQSGRTIQEQCELEIQSRINKKKDLGYCDTVEKAIANKGKNASGLPRPMLAKKWNPEKPPDMKGACVQYKYDGHRCVIYNDGERNRAYSRNGKPIESIEHILVSMEPLPEDVFIDGELYVHGMPLQKITSLVKKVQRESLQLRFIAYDIMTIDHYKTRVEVLAGLHLGIFTQVAPCWFGLPAEELPNIFRQARDAGYEGLIIRLDGYGYEAGKRHKQLLKMKEFEDGEFEVVDIDSSTNGWAVLVCRMNNAGPFFRVTAPGTEQDKIHVLRNSHNFIGKWIRVEYANLTIDGIPFHPVAIAWRDKENE